MFGRHSFDREKLHETLKYLEDFINKAQAIKPAPKPLQLTDKWLLNEPTMVPIKEPGPDPDDDGEPEPQSPALKQHIADWNQQVQEQANRQTAAAQAKAEAEELARVQAEEQAKVQLAQQQDESYLIHIGQVFADLRPTIIEVLKLQHSPLVTDSACSDQDDYAGTQTYHPDPLCEQSSQSLGPGWDSLDDIL